MTVNGELLANAVNVTILITAVGVGYVALKKWIRKTVADPLDTTPLRE